MHEPGIDDDQPDWDYLMSKDNKTVEELSREEINLLREYENNQAEIIQSGLPSYLVEIYSSSRVIHPHLKDCAKCKKAFVVQLVDMEYDNTYCSLDCSQRDQQ